MSKLSDDNIRCPECNDIGAQTIRNPNRILNWLGFYSNCEKCGQTIDMYWTTKTILMLILSIMCFQIILSLFLYPILTAFMPAGVTLFLSFVGLHLLLTPLYLKAGIIFTAYTLN